MGVVQNLCSGQGVCMPRKVEPEAAEPVRDRGGTAVARGRMLGSATLPIPQPLPFVPRVYDGGIPGCRFI